MLADDLEDGSTGYLIETRAGRGTVAAVRGEFDKDHDFGLAAGRAGCRLFNPGGHRCPLRGYVHFWPKRSCAANAIWSLRQLRNARSK